MAMWAGRLDSCFLATYLSRMALNPSMPRLLDSRDQACLDWSDRYGPVVEACRKLRCRSALIDGEIIVQDNNGISDFAALRKAIDREPDRLVMFAFDLLFLDGADLRREPLWHRREELRQLIRPDPRSALHFNDHYEGDGVVLFKQACVLGLEGIVSKRALSPYKSGPSKFWPQSQECG